MAIALIGRIVGVARADDALVWVYDHVHAAQSITNGSAPTVDGVADAEPLLAVAAPWAARMETTLRIVTVYEPVLADLVRPEHGTRRYGPSGDPANYLEGLSRDVAR